MYLLRHMMMIGLILFVQSGCTTTQSLSTEQLRVQATSMESALTKKFGFPINCSQSLSIEKCLSGLDSLNHVELPDSLVQQERGFKSFTVAEENNPVDDSLSIRLNYRQGPLQMLQHIVSCKSRKDPNIAFQWKLWDASDHFEKVVSQKIGQKVECSASLKASDDCIAGLNTLLDAVSPSGIRQFNKIMISLETKVTNDGSIHIRYNKESANMRKYLEI